jgi:hypothetical protein
MTCPSSITIDDDPTVFTPILSDFDSCIIYFFEVISLLTAYFKTLWAISIAELIDIDGQMAVMASQPIVPFRQKHEMSMIA